jgi:hypothetical protein
MHYPSPGETKAIQRTDIAALRLEVSKAAATPMIFAMQDDKGSRTGKLRKSGPGIGKACGTSLLARGAAVAGLDISLAVQDLPQRKDSLVLLCDLIGGRHEN